MPLSVASLGWTWRRVGEAFNNLFDACAAQPECEQKYGDVAAVFGDQVDRLEANPLRTTARYSPDGPLLDVVLDGGALVNWLVAAGPNFARVPSAIQELVDGNPTQIAADRAALANPAGEGVFGYGLTYGVFCSEWIPYEPQSEILAKGLLAFPSDPPSVLSQAPQLPFDTEDCAVWDVPTADPSIRDVTISSIPTLVISGSFDAKNVAAMGEVRGGDVGSLDDDRDPGDWALRAAAVLVRADGARVVPFGSERGAGHELRCGVEPEAVRLRARRPQDAAVVAYPGNELAKHAASGGARSLGGSSGG